MNTRQVLFSLFVGMSLILISQPFASLIPAVNSMMWLGAALIAATLLNLGWQQLSPAIAKTR
jgi:hypothetical protein